MHSTSARLPYTLIVALLVFALVAASCGPSTTAASAGAGDDQSGDEGAGQGADPLATTPPLAEPNLDADSSQDDPDEGQSSAPGFDGHSADDQNQPSTDSVVAKIVEGDPSEAASSGGDSTDHTEDDGLYSQPVHSVEDEPIDAEDPEHQNDGGEPSEGGNEGDGGDPDAAVGSPSHPGSGDDSFMWQRIEQSNEILGAHLAWPEQVLIADDGRTVLVRFWGGAQPCSAAKVNLIERHDIVEVRLKVGSTPNAAAMACIAIAAAYEIAVPLSSDLAGRELKVVTQDGFVTPSPDGPVDPPPALPDVEFSTHQYVGLTEIQATELATVEGRELRIVRIDNEIFPVTMDYSPSRVNIELDGGIVVLATEG